MPTTTLTKKLNQLQSVRAELKKNINAAGAAYPPARITMLAIKDQLRLELWVATTHGQRYVKAYAIKAASGVAGPKRVEGDRQVPEGIYAVTALNPESRYHLSLRLGYPNAFDLKWAQTEGRDDPGGDIYIHGGAKSVGCLAMGDDNVEQIFVLAADTGIANVSVLIAPRDPRRKALAAGGQPDWVAGLYDELGRAFNRYQR